MIKETLVCVCIPNYNNEKTLSQTLDSLVKQTYPNIIIKVFDNASTDGSLEILRAYEAKYPYLHVIQNETNIGGEANFTKCIENMEGEYGAIYHADDLYSPTMVEEQINFLVKNSGCSAVATHGYIIDENSTIVGKRYIPKEFQKDFIIGNQLELFRKILQYGNFITCPSVMAKTEIYKNKVQEWRGSRFKTSADLDVWLRLAEFGKFGFISKPLIYYRESSSSYSFQDRRARIDENNMFLVFDYYINKYKEELRNEDFLRYKFLVFKDNVNRTINQIIMNNKNTKLAIDFFTKDVLKVGLESKHNFKIYLIGGLVKMLRNVYLPENIRKVFFDLRFGKTT